ncbi:MAG TPA: response regulator transcription factor [Acidimicrobiia bacterium]|jgi:DNA-binding response OmpR family regulator
MATVLVIEDDADIRRLVADALAKQGHTVESAEAALPGLKAAVELRPDLVILDLGLPDLDGAELLRMLRAVSEVPVIAATARGEESDIVATLDAGADDYLVKPFSVAQLEARVRAVLRRTRSSAEPEVIEFSGLRIEPHSRAVTLDDRPLSLTPKEFDLLLYLAERPGHVVSRKELLAEVWRMPYGGGDRTVDVHLSELRKKLGESAASPRFIHTVHGVGVKFVEPEP